MNNSYAVTVSQAVSCPKSTSNMVWVDGNSVGLGCLGFSSKAGYRRSNSPLAINVCKKAHSKAHLVEIYNKSQIRFMMSAKVENYVYSKIGARGWTWWIGGEGKHGRWKWTHSNKPIKYWATIGNLYGYKGYQYLRLKLSKTKGYFFGYYNKKCQMICQISK